MVNVLSKLPPSYAKKDISNSIADTSKCLDRDKNIDVAVIFGKKVIKVSYRIEIV